MQGRGGSCLPTESACLRQSLLASSGSLGRVLKQFGDCILDFRDGLGIEQTGGIASDLWQACRIGAGDRHAAGHRLQHGQAKPFIQAGKNEQGRCAV